MGGFFFGCAVCALGQVPVSSGAVSDRIAEVVEAFPCLKFRVRLVFRHRGTFVRLAQMRSVYESNHSLQQRHRNHHFGNASNQKHDPNHSIINHSLYYRILPIVKTMGIHSKNKKQHHQIEQAMREKRHHKKYNAAKSHIQHACRKEHPCCKTNSTPQNKWCNLLQRRIRHKADEQK